MPKPTTGRPSLFGPKDPKKMPSIQLTRIGHKALEVAKKRLVALTGWPLYRISYSDTTEFLALGEEAAREELRRRGFLKPSY